MYSKVNLAPIVVPSPVSYTDPHCIEQRNIIATLISEYVSPALTQHLLSVECAMYELAHFYNESSEAEKWALSGLLHDIDWDACGKDSDLHCGSQTQEWLRNAGIDQELIENACSHFGSITIEDEFYGFNEGPGLPIDSKLRQVLFAVDELCGLIFACALVRPSKSISDMEVSSVMKKLKDKSFAAQVDRNLIKSVEKTLKTEYKDFVETTLKSLQKYVEVLEKVK
jgi:predicted hydrolase (HD superfamily)